MRIISCRPINTFDEAGFAPTWREGRDLMACAQTGSGKTAAFLFPMINTLLGSRPPGKDGMQATPQVVIMAPTRELVIQIYDESRKFCGGP